MLVITSPAKTQDFSDWQNLGEIDKNLISEPEFLNEADEINEILKTKSKSDLQKLMNISEKLADLNFDRFEKWDKNHKENNSKPAVLAYKGDIYRELNPLTYSKDQQKYANETLRIITGFYGFLKPYDLMQAYRLEMKIKLENKKGKDLYEFWKSKLTKEINNSNSEILVDLASEEYSKAINFEELSKKVIKIEFRQIKQGKEKNYGIYAKKARGQFIEFMIQNLIININELKNFKTDGYSFSREESGNMFFVKEI